MKTKLCILLSLILSTTLIYATQDREKSFFVLGVEASQANDIDRAIDMFRTELYYHPKDGTTWGWLSAQYGAIEDYNLQLQAANNAIKYTSKKDAYFLAWSYSSRAKAYLKLNDTRHALADMNMSIKVEPNNSEWYINRGVYYYSISNMQKSNADFRMAISLNPNDYFANLCYGNNVLCYGKPIEALPYFNHACALTNYQNSTCLSYRGECYEKLKEYELAAVDFVEAIRLDGDRHTMELLENDMADSTLKYLYPKLQAIVQDTTLNPTKQYIYWLALGYTYKNLSMHQDAYVSFIHCQTLREDISFYELIGLAELELGWYEDAIESFNNELLNHPNSVRAQYFKAECYGEIGKFDEAISQFIQIAPNLQDPSAAYYKCGWYSQEKGDYIHAKEYYDKAIEADPVYAYSYSDRARVLLHLGDTLAAIADHNKVIQLEPIPADGACVQFSHLALGDTAKAIQVVTDLVLSQHAYYDAACVYSLCGDIDNALMYFQKALEDGYRRFNHVMVDEDLKNIRSTPTFNELITEYKQRAQWEYKKLHQQSNDQNNFLGNEK